MNTEITRADEQLIAELLGESRAKETRRSYASAIRTFTAWAEPRNNTVLPAEPITIAAYIAHRDKLGRSYSTISHDVAAIAALHADKGYPDPTQNHGVRQVMRAIARRKGTRPQRQAAPMTVDLLRTTLDAMPDRDEITGKRDAAVILLGFAAALRRSELAALNVGDLTFRTGRDENGEKTGGILLTLRFSKSDQEGRGDVIGIPYGANPDTCPVVAVEQWLYAAGRAHDKEAPLFSRIFSAKKIGTDHLSDRTIARIIQGRAEDAGISERDARSWVSGHSLRAGHATTAAENGVDLATIARTTRHKRLDTLARYIRPARAMKDSTAGQIGL